MYHVSNCANSIWNSECDKNIPLTFPHALFVLPLLWSSPSPRLPLAAAAAAAAADTTLFSPTLVREWRRGPRKKAESELQLHVSGREK